MIEILIPVIMVGVTAYVIGKGNGYGEGWGKGYATGFLHGSEMGIKDTTGCLKRTLQRLGATDTWIAALFQAMKRNIDPVVNETNE